VSAIQKRKGLIRNAKLGEMREQESLDPLYDESLDEKEE